MGDWGGGYGEGGGKRERLYTYRYTVTTRMGSSESHFYVSLTVRDKVTRPNRGPSAYLPNALPLGQTGSLNNAVFVFVFLTIYVFGSYRSRFSVSYGHVTVNLTATQMLIGRVLIDGAILFQFGDTGNSLRL